MKIYNSNDNSNVAVINSGEIGMPDTLEDQNKALNALRNEWLNAERKKQTKING